VVTNNFTQQQFWYVCYYLHTVTAAATHHMSKLRARTIITGTTHTCPGPGYPSTWASFRIYLRSRSRLCRRLLKSNIVSCPTSRGPARQVENTNAGALQLGTNRAQSVTQFNCPEALEMEIVFVCCRTLLPRSRGRGSSYSKGKKIIWVLHFMFEPRTWATQCEPRSFSSAKKESALFLLFSCILIFLFFRIIFIGCRRVKKNDDDARLHVGESTN
jgi:hypothetical protein